MAARTLEQLVALGLLAPKRPDQPQVARWLARSRKDLHLAGDLLAGVDRERAMAVAYEAGYRACAGILDLAGSRASRAIIARRSTPRRWSLERSGGHCCVALTELAGSATRLFMEMCRRSGRPSSSSCSMTWGG